MWIESHGLSTVRRRIVSPPGYQSPALGDSVPVPGLQEVHQRVTLQPGVTTSTLSRVPRLFASVISSIRTHREVDSEPRISQWWGHRGLHQDEVLECQTTEETRQVSPDLTVRQLTTISFPPTPTKTSRSQTDGAPPCNRTRPPSARTPAAFGGNDPSEPSIARVLAAFEGKDVDDDASSSATLVPPTQKSSSSDSSRHSTRNPLFTPNKPSLPHNESYARHLCLSSSYSAKEDPPPDETSFLTLEDPGNDQPYTHPEYRSSIYKLSACQQTTLFPSIMSSTTPSVGDDAQRNKTRNTNNSASREIVTPLATKKKGKGVSVTEELDPEAVSPTNDNPIPSHGPILTGPHPQDKNSTEEMPPRPAASQSAKRTSAANRSASAPSSSSKAATASVAAPQSTNHHSKVPRKPSSSIANRPPLSSQLPQVVLSESTRAFREDILNLQTTVQTETVDDDTHTSSSSRTEGRKDQDAAPTEHEESEYHTVFRDIEPVSDLPIWVEPINRSTEHIFGKFNPAEDEDVLVPLSAIDGVIPGRSKHECDRLRCAIELIYNTPKDCRWDNLGAAVRKFAEYEVSKSDLVRHSGWSVTYGIERTLLLEAAQVVVTVDQVLQVLADFFHKRD